jgi:hypothetical protein
MVREPAGLASRIHEPGAVKLVMRQLRIILGVLICCSAIATPWLCLERPAGANADQHPAVIGTLWHYWTGQQKSLTLEFSDAALVARGDPIFIEDAAHGLQQVGEVQYLTADQRPSKYRLAQVREARALLYPTAPKIIAGSRITYSTTPESLSWVVQTLLSGDRKQRVIAELDQALNMHRAEILAALAPVVRDSLRDMFLVVEQDLPPALDRHQKELDALGEKYQQLIVKDQFVPLVKNEIWPIVLDKAEPELREIGRELWQHVSLWRFGWSAIYDKTPLPERNMTDREWKRFVETHALPVLREHSDALVAVVKSIVEATARNEKVKGTLRHSITTIADDPEFQRVSRQIFAEVVIDNPRFREAFDRQWTGEQARHALEITSARLEPTVRRIADMLLGTPHEGIAPEFARVLRTQILAKDRRWFLLQVPSEAQASTQPDVSTLHVELSAQTDRGPTP